MIGYIRTILISMTAVLVLALVLTGCSAGEPTNTPASVDVKTVETTDAENRRSPASVFSKATGVTSKDKQITLNVTPSTVTYDEFFDISIDGLGQGGVIPPGSLTVEGVKLQIPGYFGVAGEIPRGGRDGGVTFSTKVPANTESGTRELVLTLPNQSTASTSFNFHGASITMSDTEPAPNQKITIVGSLFRPLSAPGRREGMRTHQVSGQETSVVSLNGMALHAPNVDYPIMIDRLGTFSAEITLPAALIEDESKIQVVDTGGRVGNSAFHIANPHVDIQPSDTYPGETLVLNGTGFPARNDIGNETSAVDVVYSYVIDEGKPTQHYRHVDLGQVAADEHGQFSWTSAVPEQARIPSNNLIVFTASSGEPLAIEHDIPGPVISVEPVRAYSGSDIAITLRGQHTGYVLPPGAVTLGGARLDMPGYFGAAGTKPTTDDIGEVTYRTTIPKDVLPGQKWLVFDLPGGGQLSTSLLILEADLSFTPDAAVPGQVITVESSGFGVSGDASSSQGARSKIAGEGDSYVNLDGTKLKPPYVDYPIEITADGDLAFELRLPIGDPLLGKLAVEIEIIDTMGRRGSGLIYLLEPSVYIFPTESDRGSTISVIGMGFQASPKLKAKHQVDLFYGEHHVGTAYTDEEGSFESDFIVPAGISAGVSYLVAAQTTDQTLVVEHTVPSRYLSVIPDVISIGEALTIRGAGFLAFTKVKMTLGDYQVAPPIELSTDRFGTVEVIVDVPASIRLGERSIRISVHDESIQTTVEVID